MSSSKTHPSSPEAGQTTRQSSGHDNDNEYADAEENFKPKTFKFWIIILSVYIAIFLVALDRLIIATAIPSITNQFHSVDDIGWYGSSYMMTCAIFSPLSGRIYQLYPTKWVFLAFITFFEIGSAICGAAPNSGALIAGRAVAGAGAAGIFGGGIQIIMPMVPLRKRPVFTGFFGLAFGVSSVIGPFLGGAFTDAKDLTWRWCFYINLPVGGAAILAIFLFFKLESSPTERIPLLQQLLRLDPVGCLFFAPSMICLILALQWGGNTDPWSSPKVIGVLVTFGLTFVMFLVVEVLTPETAMAPTRVILNRSVAGGMLSMFLMMGGTMAVIYYLSIWFQAVQGLSAFQAGVRTIPLVVAMVIFGIVVSVVTQKIGYYVPSIYLSCVLCAVGGGMLSTLRPNSGAREWIGYQVISGFGMGAGQQAPSLAPQKVLRRADVPLGTALIFFSAQLGGAVFVAVSQNIFAHQLFESLEGMSGVDAHVIINAGATAYRRIVPSNELGAVIQAYNYSLTRVFILAAALGASMVVAAALMEWKSVKDKSSGATPTEKTDPEDKQNMGSRAESLSKAEE